MKIFKVFVCTVVLISLILSPSMAMAQEKTVPVTFPEFAVTLNGVTIDNTANQYPLIVYQDITYFPMTYHGARFMHLKANWYEKEPKGVLFIGYSEAYEKEWIAYPANGKNKSVLTATIPDYRIAVNTLTEQKFIDNAQEEYPLLNFRGVTYIPLTWRFAVNEFGWQYRFNQESGLKIDATEQFRAELEDTDYLSSTMPIVALTVKSYVYNADNTAYVGYPRTNLGGATFVYQKQGGDKVYFKAEDRFHDGEYYFNCQLDEKGATVDSKIPPVLTDEGLVIQAVRMNQDGEKALSLKINFDDDITAA